MFHRRAAVVLIMLLVISVMPAYGAEVLLKDGTKISCKILDLSTREIVIETRHLGRCEFDIKDVSAIFFSRKRLESSSEKPKEAVSLPYRPSYIRILGYPDYPHIDVWFCDAKGREVPLEGRDSLDADFERMLQGYRLVYSAICRIPKEDIHFDPEQCDYEGDVWRTPQQIIWKHQKKLEDDYDSTHIILERSGLEITLWDSGPGKKTDYYQFDEIADLQWDVGKLKKGLRLTLEGVYPPEEYDIRIDDPRKKYYGDGSGHIEVNFVIAKRSADQSKQARVRGAQR